MIALMRAEIQQNMPVFPGLFGQNGVFGSGKPARYHGCDGAKGAFFRS